MKPFTEPPLLEYLSREQLIETVRHLVASLNELQQISNRYEAMLLESHRMLERAGVALTTVLQTGTGNDSECLSKTTNDKGQ